jgi:Zn-dependent peptidase ImmA (M78 family)
MARWLMPQLVCQDCGHSFYERSQLAAMSPCPVCEGELEAEYDEPVPPSAPVPTAAERAAEARARARNLLRKHGVRKAPVDVEHIARAEGLTIEQRELGEVDGRLVESRIEVNAHHSLVRQRFTIAHELGHFVMHSEHGGDEHSEREADVFAATLLMPPELLRKEFAATPDADVLRERFQVSREAIWIVLKELRLDRKVPRD